MWGIGHSDTLLEGVQIGATFLEGNLAIFIKSLKNMHADLSLSNFISRNLNDRSKYMCNYLYVDQYIP